MKEIVENNKLIAEFMKIKVIGNAYNQPIRPNLICFREDELQYHLSWDWLMPVIEKILSWDNSINANYNNHFVNQLKKFPLGTKREDYYNVCIGFINWYNNK